MPSEYPMNDPQTIWQNQPTEPLKMPENELRRKVRQRQAKARIQALVSIALGLIVCVFFAWTCARAHELLPRLGLGLLSLCGLNFVYQAYRWIWPRNLGPDATVNVSLQFYRSELERQRDYASHIWRRAGLSFCLLGLAMVVVPGVIHSLKSPRLLMNFVPVLVLLAIWLAVFFPIRKRKLHNLQQHLDELNLLEKDNR